MFERPLVIGVRQVEGAFDGQNAEAAIEGLGWNTGNMMFTEALLRVLANARWGSFAFHQEDLQGRDAIVLAAANWINSFEDFGWLVERLEKIQLPVFLVGVGAQASLGMETPEVRPGTRRLLELVRDRSVSIAARGRFSCEVLDRLGIRSAVETGCPSLMLGGPDGPKLRMGEIAETTCCMHATRHGFQKADAFQRYLYTQAFSKRLHIVLQSELSDIHYALGGGDISRVPERDLAALRDAYGSTDDAGIHAFLRQYGHVFLNYQDWISYMRTRSFCFGTRIHGTVASLLAGTPATLLCHDSRTLEMAQSMSIPMLRSTDIDVDTDISVERCFLPEETAEFNVAYARYYGRYIGYLEANGLPVSPLFRPNTPTPDVSSDVVDDR